MIGYILIILFMVGCAFLSFLLDERGSWGWSFLTWVLTFVFSTLFLSITGNMGLRKFDARRLGEERDFYQELVLHISDDMSFKFVDCVIDECETINERIVSARVHKDSKMWGCLFNKHIAELELIEIPEFEYKIEKTEKDESD
jgi:hypothetical protein